MKKYRPTTAGQRHMMTIERNSLTAKKPCKGLVAKQISQAGRDSTGKITVRHRGGGVKRHLRIIDYKGIVENIKGIVKSIEYDPNRSANICLIDWANGQKTYILQPSEIKVGDRIECGEDVEIKTGNRLRLENIPTGVKVHNIELIINRGGQLARSAGSYGLLMAKANNYATIKLPSGEIRMVNLKCKATIGEVGNSEHRNRSIGKAGRKRKMGFRPSVRGSVMNPCDHPHGGGEGKAPIGRPSPLSPTGKKTLGFKTRKQKKVSQKYILKRRK